MGRRSSCSRCSASARGSASRSASPRRRCCSSGSTACCAPATCAASTPRSSPPTARSAWRCWRRPAPTCTCSADMAVPHPEQELARVQQLLRKELPPLVVLAGPGAWFREAALAKVLAAVPADAELATVDGQDVEVRGLPGEEGGAAETGDDEADADAPPAACRDLELLRG